MPIEIHTHLLKEENIPAAFHSVLEQVYSDEFILKSKQSEFIQLQYAFCSVVALNDSIPVGRLIIYQNPYHLIEGKPAIAIGYLEIIENGEIWNKLFQRVEVIAKELQVEIVIGPMNGSTWEQYRLSEPSDKPLFLSEPFYPDYYYALIQKQGYKSLADYVSNMDRIMDWRKERLLKKEEELKSILSIRPLKMEHLKQELEDIFPIVEEAFRENFLYSPIDKDFFADKYSKLKNIITPEMVLVAEDSETGEKAGFIFAFPDLLNKTGKGLIIKTLARNKARKYAGIGSVLSNIVTKYAYENGYDYCIHAFMITTNSSTVISGSFTGEEYKRHTLFYKDFSYE